MQALVGEVAGPYFLDLESWAANRRHLLLFLYLMGNANVVLLSGDVHYGFTSTVKFSVFDDKTLREAIRQFPKDVSPPVSPQGGSPSYDFLWAAKFIQLTSSALKNFANDTAVGVPAGFTLMEPALFLKEDGGMVKGKYDAGELFEWVVPLDDKFGKFVSRKKSDLKPASLFRQRVNDALNTQYISEHNIGLLTINLPEIGNCFYTSKGRTAEPVLEFLE